MISALRTQAGDFELSKGWLKHAPSRHKFRFDNSGNVTLDAHCDCALLSIAPQQREELWQAFRLWRETYWRPVEINRQFARHFQTPNALQRVIRRIDLAWRRLIRNRFDDRVAATPSADPAAAHLAPAE
jgi:hypothetical protein